VAAVRDRGVVLEPVWNCPNPGDDTDGHPELSATTETTPATGPGTIRPKPIGNSTATASVDFEEYARTGHDRNRRQ